MLHANYRSGTTVSMTNTTNSMVSLATQMNLSPAEAIALPTTITVAAKSQGMAESRMLWIAQTNIQVREYLAGVCRKAAR